jgi:hypothetical protein
MALKEFRVTKIVTTEVSNVFYAEDEGDAIKTSMAFDVWPEDTKVTYVDYSADEA